MLVLLTGSAIAQPFGIEQPRLANTDLVLSELPADQPGSMTLERVFPQLSFAKQVLLIEAPDGSDRMFLVSQTGVIYTFPRVADPAPGDVSVFLDISGRTLDSGERGLLGLAFDPDYGSNGEFYVSYVTSGGSGVSRLSRFVNSDPSSNTVDSSVSNEEIILSLSQDYSNHNGGMIAFGPDNMLYFGLGDGGSGNDPLNRAQDTTNLFGAMLRLDVRSEPEVGETYVIPPDNPFVGGGPAGTSTREEIWAYGLRNPWRFSFDMLHGYLIAADVGQSAREEVDVIVKGGNYGWRVMEGTRCNFPAEGCDNPDFIPPITEYPRSVGQSITGGYVYYGNEVPELYGMYIYGDFGSQIILGLKYDGESATTPVTLVASAGFGIAGFGQDSTGEVYVLDYAFGGGGGIYVLRPATPTPSNFPQRLSDMPALLTAGSGEGHTIDGVIPYRPAAELWSDGAFKERYLALPGLAQAGFTMAGGWDFPNETLLVKNFILPMDERDPENTLRRIETRLLLRLNDTWHGFSYEWNEDETDATLLTGSKLRPLELNDQDGDTFQYNWYFPSRTDCMRCHTPAANHVLGLTTPQMNSDFHYPVSGVTANQLASLDYISVFDSALPSPPSELPRMPDPLDESEQIEPRARAYIAANCAMCHQPGGPVPTSTLDLRWEAANEGMSAIDVVPLLDDLGLPDARLIAPGHPHRSVLLERMVRLDSTRMPPLASSRVDENAVDLIAEWIQNLGFTGVESWYLY